MATHHSVDHPRDPATLSVDPALTSRRHGGEFLDALLSFPMEGPEGLSPLRAEAREHLNRLAVPTPRAEDWKYTDLSGLIQHRFQPAVPLSLPLSQISQISALIWREASHSCLVFLNGIYAPELSNTSGLPKALSIAPLSQLPPDSLPPQLQQIAGEDVFTTLNTAGFLDAALLEIPRGIEVDAPIQLLFLTLPDPSSPRLSQPRLLLVAGSSSCATVIEDHLCLDAPANQGVHFTNAVTEILLAANAQLTHIRHHREGSQTCHIAKTAIHQGRDSRYLHYGFELAGQLTRHTLELVQTGESAEANLQGLTLAAQRQLADTHTTIDHRVPHCTSQQLHKQILRDSAHGVFNGRLLVRQAAQLTQASQSSRNLLLSPKARVDTKPQLEIFADDVKCAHGATVSQLEADEVFYLQSRGIDAEQARSLLTYGFAAELLLGLPLPSLQDYLRQQILAFTQITP